MSSIPFHKFPSKYWTGNPSNAIIRAQFVRNKAYPTVSEIRDNLGSIMAEVFFSDLTPEVRECIGLGTPLEGPQGSLWNSPSNQLQGKNKLVKVPSLRFVQNFTHDAIIEMGLHHEMEQEEKNKKWVEEAVAKKEKEMEKIMQEKIREMRERTKCEFFELYSLRLKEVFNQLKSEFEEQLAEKERLIRQELEAEKLHAIKTLKKSMSCEVESLLRELDENFDVRLKYVRDWDANSLHEEYKQLMNYYLKKWSRAFQDAKETSKEEKRKALADADILHYTFTLDALQREKEKFNTILVEVLSFFKGRLNALAEELNKLKQYIRMMDLENVAALEREAWECVLKDVLLQFQKFINYVLEEVPGQANYLLSLSEILQTRKECLRKVKGRKFHTVSPQLCLERQWGDILVHADEPYEEPHVPMAQSSVCHQKTVSVESSEISESLNNLLRDTSSSPELANWTKIVVNWLCKRLGGIDEEPPRLPHRTSSEGSTDSDLVHYLDDVVKKGMDVPKQERKVTGLEKLTEKVQQLNVEEKRDFKIVGADDPHDPVKEGFPTRRLDSIIDILILHPELKNVIIKP